MVYDDADGKAKFTEEFFRSRVEIFNASTPLMTIKRFTTLESAKQDRSKYPFLIFEINKQGPDQAIRPEDIQGLYCQTPLGKYQFVKNPLS
jgi:hypothetical protein